MIKFKVHYLKKNMGHGNARRKGLAECENGLVALMDSDDISLPVRFERQLEAFVEHPELSIVGGQIAEFVNTQEHITGIREVPEKDRDIKNYMKRRCPMNQVSVMFKKDAVQEAGGYMDWYCEEDYYLWARMALNGCKFYNVPETLVNVRVGDGMSSRRGGLKYFRSEAGMQYFLYRNRLVSLPQYFYNVLLRFGGEVLLPNAWRVKMFRLFRKQYSPGASHTAPQKKIENEYAANNSSGKFPPFSVSMCVYGGDNAGWFDEALRSVIEQTVRPQEIVLVVDGPVPDEIQEVIGKYQIICEKLGGGGISFRVIRLEENKGHGTARRSGLENCNYSWVALMDADDICVPDRFEQQLKMMAGRRIDMVGGDIEEFTGSVDYITGRRRVPVEHCDIIKFMKKRCPFNQMTVMFRKETVERAGGYLDWYCNEDYYLWIRMALTDAVMANTGTSLVKARTGEKMYQRRGGWSYFYSEAKLQIFMYRQYLIGPLTLAGNIGKRFVVQVLLPNKLRGIVFRKFAREKA